MSVIANQREIFLRLAAELRPHWRRDPAFAHRLQALLARQRAFGSRDRRLYRELLYTAVRFAPWIEPLLTRDPVRAAAVTAWLAADLPATRDFRHELTAGWPACPAALAERAAQLQQSTDALFPAWLHDECPAAGEPAEMDALHRRAALWLRVQADDPAPIRAEFSARGWEWRPSPLRADAIEVVSEADVTRSDSYQQGRFEIQDLGSQLILASAGLPAGGRWLDACAGAGGKTLQLARILGPTGRVEAHDIRPAALEELGLRARRAGLGNIAVLKSAPGGDYDGVLVDAPCSGSGTWRRAPQLKWTTTAAQVAQHAATQRELLARFAALVRPGGRLIYATCSLAAAENEGVVRAFLAAHPQFEPVPPAADFAYPRGDCGLSLRPARHNTDGFYVAALRRR